jgi:uncharacterized protein
VKEAVVSAPQAFAARHQFVLYLLVAFAVSWVTFFAWLAGLAAGPELNPFGPVIGCLLVYAMTGGWAGLRTNVARMAHVRGIGARTWLLAALAPVAVGAVALASTLAVGSRLPVPLGAVNLQAFAGQLLFMFFVVGLGEEPGWRGFLQTWLGRNLSPLTGAAAMAAIWMAWHTPMFMDQARPETLLPHLMGQAGVCVFLIWITNKARGSVVPAMLCHAVANAFNGALGIGAGQLLPMWFAGAAWIVAAAVLIVWTRGRLGYDASAAIPQSRPAAAPA